MTHLTFNGDLCALKDGHAAKCRSIRQVQAYNANRAEVRRRRETTAKHAVSASIRIDPRELAWQEGALCGQPEAYDPDLWFPEDWVAEPGTMQYIKQVERAKRTCAACPLQLRCLQYAHEKGITSGIWGGLMPDERAEMTESA